MGYRTHTTNTDHVVPMHVEHMADFFNEEAMAEVGPGIVLNDPGNLEAFVIKGTPEQIRKFALDIIRATPPAGKDAPDLVAAGLTLTVAELVAHLAQFPADMPITATQPDGDSWLNVTGATNPRATDEPSIILSTNDNFDPRQF